MLSELYKKRWFCAHLCSVCLALWRFSVRSPLVSSEVDCVRLCAKIDYVHLWCEELKRFREFVRDVKLWPAPEPPWRWSPSWARSPPASARVSPQSLRIYHSPASAPPRDPTAGSCYPRDPPFWPETPSITIQLSLLSFNSTYIYDLGLLLLLPTGAASHVQERHLAPQPWEQKWSKQQVCEDWWKTFWIVLGFILKENLNPRVLYVLMIKHTKCQISWEVDSSCLFND